jgi:1,2-diacylglycerol 3-beta-glucosyltransferase
VVVWPRNEEPVIGRLLQSLASLQYPENKLEIILVDDDSSDNTQNIMNSFAAGKSTGKSCTMINAPPN